MDLFIALFLIGWLPIHLEPYYHQNRVSFFEWLRREVYEVIYGEKAKAFLALQHAVQIEPFIDEYLSQLPSFNYAVDMGSGRGSLGYILRRHSQYLVGVDKNLEFLKVAETLNVYDELVNIDVRDFQIPAEADAFFLFEILEHVSKQDGLNLLKRLEGKFVMVSTPLKFISAHGQHVSLWTVNDFASLGFDVWLIPLSSEAKGNIIAVRRSS